jgi:hypothetical protein
LDRHKTGEQEQEYIPDSYWSIVGRLDISFPHPRIQIKKAELSGRLIGAGLCCNPLNSTSCDIQLVRVIQAQDAFVDYRTSIQTREKSAT